MLKSKKEGDKMQTFLENTLHQQIEITEFQTDISLPLVIKNNIKLYSANIFQQSFLIAKPIERKLHLSEIRKYRQNIEHLTKKHCAFYFEQMNYYTVDKMIEEGMPFIWDHKQLYLPFIGILLENSHGKELKICEQISFLTQKLLLEAIYHNWQNMTATSLAKQMDVSNMSITRCFDEMEILEIPLLYQKGRSRLFNENYGPKEMWEVVQPYLRNPIIREFYLKYDLKTDLLFSGMSALSQYTLLEDNSYNTYAITKNNLKKYAIKEQQKVHKEDTPGCIVQELGYQIAFPDQNSIDPLSIYLIFKEYADDPRIDMALDEMMETLEW